ncbi:MAG TPA: hypothetical protein VGF67_31095 [Ktedonobacteraceae bacterium]|jgi:hypothetical protein
MDRQATAPKLDRFVVLDLSAYWNNDGISYAHNRADGWFNVWGNTFPAEALPASGSMVQVAGVPFRFPRKEDGQQNNVCCCGQIVPVPPACYDWIYVLAASERRAEDLVYLHYASGGGDYEWLRISDFWPETAARFGEIEAFRAPALHYPRHTQDNMRPVIWCQRIPVTRQQEPLTRLCFPENIAIHLFALTLLRRCSPGHEEEVMEQ